MNLLNENEVVNKIKEDVELINHLNTLDGFKEKKSCIYEKMQELNIEETNLDFLSILEGVLEI